MTSFYTFIYLVLAPLIIQSSGFLSVLFLFIGNTFDQASIAKEQKKVKRGETGITQRG